MSKHHHHHHHDHADDYSGNCSSGSDTSCDEWSDSESESGGEECYSRKRATSDESDGGIFKDASKWWTNTKDMLRSAAFGGMQDVLRAYANSIALHGEANPFPVEKLAGGPQAGDTVLVVGAGPAGVHMAMKLQQLGHEVTLLEKNEIGGKARSRHYRDAVHEMGACYLSPDYEQVVLLLQEHGLAEQMEVKKRTVWRDKNADTGVKFRAWFYQAAKDANGDSDASDGSIALEVFRQALRYIHLHRELLQNYTDNGFMPPRPTDEHLRELKLTIGEFFARHDLRALAPVFKLAYTLQGYGFTDAEPILYGMLWVTPKLINALIEQLKVRNKLGRKHLRQRGTPESITTLRRGFGTLFQSIVDRCQERAGRDGEKPFRVKQQVNVTSLVRDRAGVHVGYHESRAPDSTVNERYDFLVLAVPMPQILHQIDVRDGEKEAFSSLHESTFITSLVDYTPGKKADETAVDNWMDNIVPERPLKIWAFRDTHQVMRQNSHHVHVHPHDVGTLVSYQYVSDSFHNSKELTKEDEERQVAAEVHAAEQEVRSHMERIGKQIVRFEQHRFRYFPRHSPEKIGEGVLWDIMEMQGKHRTWYVGSAMSFEAVNAIVGYNEQLLKVWKRQLDDETVLATRGAKL